MAGDNVLEIQIVGDSGVLAQAPGPPRPPAALAPPAPALPRTAATIAPASAAQPALPRAEQAPAPPAAPSSPAAPKRESGFIETLLDELGYGKQFRAFQQLFDYFLGHKATTK